MSHVTLPRPDVVTTLLARYCPPVMIFLIYLGHTEVGFCSSPDYSTEYLRALCKCTHCDNLTDTRRKQGNLLHSFEPQSSPEEKRKVDKSPASGSTVHDNGHA
jgi:hypothetical protein